MSTRETACHKILGDRSEAWARVRETLEAADDEGQWYERAAHVAARGLDIDPTAFTEAARAGGRAGRVAVLAEETRRRRDVVCDAIAYDVDFRASYHAAEAQAPGSGFAAIEASVQRRRQAVAAAQRLNVDVNAVCAAARRKGEDPSEVLQEETAWRTRVLLVADVVGISAGDRNLILREAEDQIPGSGYTALGSEGTRRLRREQVRKELPFDHSRPAHTGTWALALTGESRRNLLRTSPG